MRRAVLASIAMGICVLFGHAEAHARLGGQPYAITQKVQLPQLNIDPGGITVSGVSSGGFMAVQAHVANSAVFSGAASVAGGIYWCAEGSQMKTFMQCMAMPQQIDVRRHVEHAYLEARAGHIDPLEHLRDDRVYMFASPQDYNIRQANSDKLLEFYSAFVPKSNISYRKDFASAHGFPTADYGAGCKSGGSPWLLNCGFDTAKEILESLYGRQDTKGTMDTNSLFAFEQAEFGAVAAGLHRYGWMYVPKTCAQGARCRLHVALHGCQMNPDFIQDAFGVHSGFNTWAETNRTVILYPNVAKSSGNPFACWDWYGMTGPNYASKEGAQIKSIRAMVDRLAGTRGSQGNPQRRRARAGS